jgi:hypothetical protein
VRVCYLRRRVWWWVMTGVKKILNLGSCFYLRRFENSSFTCLRTTSVEAIIVSSMRFSFAELTSLSHL